MTYQERVIPKENLKKFLGTLDSDEGIRIDNGPDHIFINRTAKRYCVNISVNNRDEFIYKISAKEVMDFLEEYIKQTSRIFAY